MLRNYAYDFYKLGQSLDRLWALAYQRGLTADEPMDPKFLSDVSNELFVVLAKCKDMGLTMSVRGVERITESPPSTYAELGNTLPELQRRIEDELQSVYFLHIPTETRNYYLDEPQFGSKVAAKLPLAIDDIQEAGKCFATGRYTACVFHLMRVMEFAVQYLGKKMNITLVNQKNWHNILEEVDKSIRKMPVAKPREKARRNKYAESSAHLRMVKDAWRNEVMHPKATYTPEEAERVLRNVKDFMIHLATKL